MPVLAGAALYVGARMPSLTAPEAVRAELRRGLAWADDGHGGDGLKPETKAWADRKSTRLNSSH